MHEGAPAVVLPPAEPFPSPVVSRRISAGASSETPNDAADDQMSKSRARGEMDADEKAIAAAQRRSAARLVGSDGKILGFGGNARRGLRMLGCWLIFTIAYVLGSVLLASYLASS